MSKINLSDVRNFKEFLNKIKGNLNLDSSNHTLKIYCLNSELSKEEFEEEIISQYPNSKIIEDFISTNISELKNDDDINLYSYKDPSSPAIFVLSIFGKGKLDTVVDQLIKKLPKTYYFWLPVSIFDEVKEEIIDNFTEEGISIDYFTALRAPHFENNCDFRPNEKRRIEYSGRDGLEVMREMRQFYGVLPKKISFQVGKKIKFSMDQRNTFIINQGLPYLNQVLDVIQIGLSKFAKIEEILSEIRFEKVQYNGNVDFEITPLNIEFSNKKNVEDIEHFFNLIESNQEGRYSVINPLLIEGSLFFSATILDVNKKAMFSITGNEKNMNILPQIRCGKETISRFYEEVDLNLDNHTMLIKQND